MRSHIRAMSIVTALLVTVSMVIPMRSASAAAPAFRALLFTRAAGYVHDSIPAGIDMITKQAQDENFDIVQSADPAVFTDANLATFDVLIMLQNSGMVWDTEAQRQAVQNYVHSGKGIVAIHNATDMGIENEFPWWDDVVNGGAHMPAHSPGVLPGTAKVADRVHPSTKGLPERWQRPEEWYNFDKNARGTVHVLVTADETTYDPGGSAMGYDHPISWCRNAEGGKVWSTAMGHATASYGEPFFKEHVLGGIKWAAGAEPGDCGGTVWSGYEKTALDDNTADPMELDVAKDGRVFYVQRSGEVKVYKPDTHATVSAGKLDVYTGGEDGLVGMELDPGFAENHWIYLYYSPAASTEDVNRLSRFTVTGDTLDLSSEKKILDVPAYRSRTFPEPGHTGGAVEFGPDGTLYLSTGDDTPPNLDPNWQGYAPIDWRPGKEMLDAARSAGNTNDLRGKILRVRPKTDGGYDIPDGNLFAPGTAKTRPEIYAMGFRNPFRFTVDQKTGWVHMSDYGPDRGGQTDARGPVGLVEYNVIKKPGNYGWPFCHGDNQPYAPYNPDTSAIGQKFDCADPSNPSPNNTGLTDLPPVQAPEMWYGYDASAEFPEVGSGGAAPMSGPVYRYDAGNPSKTKFPAYYDGASFFYEWARNSVKEIRFDSDGKLLKINDFLSTATFNKPMDMTFGPDGSLYLLEWGSAFGGGNNDSGLYRIDYAQGQRLPIAKATGTPTNGPAPLSVKFSSAGSYDPDGDALRFEWDFDGDGTFDSTEANPTHVYQTKGDFNAQLKVTDGSGKSGFANVPITVGNTIPTVTLEMPANGAMIDFGDSVPYKIKVTDPEDGEIDCSKVTINPALGHDDHEHPTTDIPGCEGTIPTDNLGGHPEGANLYFVLNAQYTDKGGPDGAAPLTGHARAVLQPKHKQAEYYTQQFGTRVVSQSGAENGKRIGDVSDGDWIAFEPMSLDGINSVAYRMSSPYGVGWIELRADAPNGQLLSTTPVRNTGGWDTYQMTAASGVSKLTGTHKLYFVFKSSQNNSFDVDAIEFRGEGAGDGVEEGMYTLTAKHSGKNAVVRGGSTANEVPIVQATANQSNEQRWQLTSLGDGSYSVKAVHSGKCLEVPAFSTEPAEQLDQWTCDGGANQRWRPVATAEAGVFSMINANSGLCMDVNGVSTADGAAIIQWNCSGAANQQWTFTKVAPSDTKAPVTTAKADPAEPTGKAGWYTSGPVSVTLNAADEDGGSGLAATEYDVDGTGWNAYSTPVQVSGDGEHTLRYRSTDKIGNVEEAGSLQLKIDTTAPLTVAEFAPPGSAGWHNGAVPVMLSATDAGSGTGTIEYSLDGGAWTPYGGTAVPVSGDGEHELRYRATDRAGVVEQVKAATLKIDGTKPTLLVAGVADGQVYGDSQDVRISWQAVDATSGVKSMTGALDGKGVSSGTVQPLYELNLGRHKVEVTAEDNAGNITETVVRFEVSTSFRDMHRLIDRFRASGRLSLSGQARLSTRLLTAQAAEAGGKEDKAVAELEKFKELVADTRAVSNADVRAVLTRDADRMIQTINA